MQSLEVERLPVELVVVLPVAHPVPLQHFVELRPVQDTAEYLHVVEQDGNKGLGLQVVFLKENEVQILVVLHFVDDLLGPVSVFVGKRLELVETYLVGTGELAEHQGYQTDDVHVVGVDALQQFFLGQ